MGSGIAAHLANLGFDVLLYDLSRESAQSAFDRAKAAKPPHFFLPETANKIQILGIETDLDQLAGVDWVCEAIIEKLDAKKALFEKLDSGLLDDRVAITTNTSGLEIRLLAEGRSKSFRRRFMGTHFFNPPRYLKLLELIPTEDTTQDALSAMTRFLEEKAARRVVPALDTPGFIANRYGMWSMFHAIHVTEKLGLSIEQVDAITGTFLGRPRSGSFRLNDLVGLDIMLDIARNLYERCPHDPFREHLSTPESMLQLLEKGWIGNKAGQGYYRREGKDFVAYDYQTKAYRQIQDASFPSLEAIAKEPLGARINKALELKDEAGEYLRNYLPLLLQYAIWLGKEISHNPRDFDRVMMWGFGWEMGPFAMIDAIGPEKFELSEPYYKPGEIRSWTGGYQKAPEEPLFRQIKDYPVVQSFSTFNVRDLGEGVKAIALTTKMGTINAQLLTELNAFLDENSGPMVLTSEARSFSLGFDLSYFAQKIDAQDWGAIDSSLELLQKTAVRLSTLPIVSAVFGYCLGGGFELALQCPIVCALADTTMGFPEAKVGLFPAGGGTAEMTLRSRAKGAKAVVEMARHLALGTVSASADHARAIGYLRESDVTVYHPEMLITCARELAKHAAAVHRPSWATLEGPVTGMIDHDLEGIREKEKLSDHDIVIGDKIKAILAKSTSFQNALDMERSLFQELCKKALSLARIKHMLETGKPLRN